MSLLSLVTLPIDAFLVCLFHAGSQMPLLFSSPRGMRCFEPLNGPSPTVARADLPGPLLRRLTLLEMLFRPALKRNPLAKGDGRCLSKLGSDDREPYPPDQHRDESCRAHPLSSFRNLFNRFQCPTRRRSTPAEPSCFENRSPV